MQRFNRNLQLFFVSFFILLFVVAVSQPSYANGSSSALVEAQWLADNLGNADIRILHGGSNEQGFNAKHIPGSVFFNVYEMFPPKNYLGGGAPPDKAAFEALMGKLGISNDTHVVIVGSAKGTPFPVTVFWLMKYHGHEKVSLLNGGITKWIAENRVMTSDATKVSPVKYTSSPDGSVFANAKHVLDNHKNPKVSVVDVRSPGEYSGKENPVNNPRTGHIPGVVHLEYLSTNLNSDGTFKSVDELKAAYEAKGVTGDKEVITYCEGGVRASNTFFVLKHILGYTNVRNYVGSWGNWSRQDPGTYPAEK